jgi:hypothetical protein
MKPPKRLFPQDAQLYVKIISSTLIPLIITHLLRERKRKIILKNNPRKNNQRDLLLELAGMYHQFTPHPRQAESAQPTSSSSRSLKLSLLSRRLRPANNQ